MSSVFLLPLADFDEVPFGVIEFVKFGAINDQDARFGEWVAKKLKLLRKWFGGWMDNKSKTEETEKPAISPAFFVSVAGTFGADVFEVWKLSKTNQQLSRLDAESSAPLTVNGGGLAAACLLSETNLNVSKAQQAAGFDLAVDHPDEPVLCHTLRDSAGFVWAFVLRGSKRGLFDAKDEARLAQVAANMMARVGSSPRGDENQDRDCVAALAALADGLAARRDSSELLNETLEKCRLATNADRCTCFLLTDNNERLVSRHQTGTKSINLPAKRGIAGSCITQRKVVLEADAYRSPVFDQRVDVKTGYRTRDILAIPLFGVRGDTVGCIELLNKTTGPFGEGDSKTGRVFGLVSGIVLENSALRLRAGDIQQRMTSLARLAGLKGDATQVIGAAVQEAHGSLGAERSACYLKAGSAFKLAANAGPFPDRIDSSNVLSRACSGTNVLVQSDFVLPEADGSKSTAALLAPLVGRRGTATGVILCLAGKARQFLDTDAEFLSAVAALCSRAIVPVDAGLQTSDDIDKVMTPNEKGSCRIPAGLALSPSEVTTVRSLNCFSPDFKGIGHFKELFFFFQELKFFDQFQITAERFFRFLSAVSERYTGTSYHNWTHACDVAQFIFFVISRRGLIATYESWELFTLLTAAICHDTNHPGLNNVFNVKAETPLGILYKETSVLEIHHVHESFPIIQRSDIDLFGSFQGHALSKVWSLFINLILATDMARHFEIVKRSQAALDAGTFVITEPEFRLLGLQLVMKVADISNVSRPFELADRWCDILNVEFFHQGDLEKEIGIGLTSPLNDRTSSNKPKSQIGFYNFICIPLYTVLARVDPSLQILVDAVRANLERWTALSQQ
jgi:3',5'-cyclic-nucleotide phosphodiesterase